MSQKRPWVETKRNFLNKVKSEVSALLGPTPRDLNRYENEYEKSFSGRWLASSKTEMLRKVASATVVLGGDFHAFNQAQRSHLRILRESKFSKPLVLALECLAAADQDKIDKLYSGEVSLTAFPQVISWETHWPFPWTNYRPIISWAVENGVRIVALGTHKKMSPKKFDKHMALIIKNNFNPKTEVLYVVTGELHISDSHLPKELESLVKIPKKDLLVLHLDSEKLYLDLLKNKNESKLEVLRKSKRHYCLLNSPPWVKWQSYLLYLEQTYDKDLDNDSGESIDLTDHVHRMIEVLRSDLGLPNETADIHVVNNTDRMMTKLIEKMDSGDRPLARWLIDQDRSFFEPRLRFLYLSRLSINHAAELAGAYIYSDLANIKRLFWKFPQDLEKQIWWESVVFLLSKLINHKRKPESLETLQTRLESMFNDSITKEVLLLSIDQRMLELTYNGDGKIPRKRKVKPRRQRVYHQAARILGQMLGERMFNQFRKSDFKSAKLGALLRLNPDSAEFIKIYYGKIHKT